MTDVDVAVIGAGLTGACTAWQLARRGIEVALIDAYSPGHTHGSSHGSARIFRRAYPDPFYVDLTAQAQIEWRRLESESATTLLTMIGGIDHGRLRKPAHLAATLSGCDVDVELLAAHDAGPRWPGMQFDGPVLFHAQAGVVNADATVRAAAHCAANLGALLLFDNPVTAIRHDGNRFRVSAPRPLTARRIVVAAGPWLPELTDQLALGTILPTLTVRQQQVFHFALRDPSASYPVFVHKDDLQMYGLPSGSDVDVPAMKIGRFDDGVVTTASTRTGTIPDELRDPVIDYVRQWLPALDPEPIGQASCLFTMTDDEDFIIDRIGPVVIASPCSGHGAKFAPLTGRLAAELVLGETCPNPRFTLR